METRIKSIDILRAFAIVFMIPFHIYIFWPSREYNLFGETIIFIGSLAAPFFILVSGISYFIFINKEKTKNTMKKEILINVVKRALFIFSFSTLMTFLFGFILNLRVSFIIYWSVFQLISFCMIIFFLLPFLRENFRYFFYCFFFIIIFLLYFVIVFNEIKVLSILVSGGDFTFLPWASFYIFGLFLGDVLINKPKYRIKSIINIILLAGMLNIILWFIWIRFITFSIISYFFISYSLFFISFSIIYFISDIRNLNSIIERILALWGRFSFSIYYIQFIFIIGGIILFPTLNAEIFSQGFFNYQFLIIFITFFIGLDIFFLIWKRFDYIFSIEWIMNKLIKKSFFSKE